MGTGGETKLSVISRHKLYVMCNCGHADSVAVLDLIQALGDQGTVGFAISKMRCSRCRAKNVREYRITFSAGP
ncbi:hypothetical protein AN476_10480 [Phaeobacter sp. 11ANDIMAR09]|nr:hypothetical protein AN476_10480 [Phaeobacter sp. 11ANDIMAR09]